MGHYYEAYVYNNSYNDFEDKPISLNELMRLENLHDGRFYLICKNLYSQKKYDKSYKPAYYNPKNRKAFLKRVNATQLKQKGFSSACESRVHDACKREIAAAEKLKIVIDGDEFIIHKKDSNVESLCHLMERDYETDCEYEIDEISQELYERLLGNIIYFEIHHSSPVKEEKGLSYMLSGKPIIEFDILTDYLPYDIKNETRAFEKCIDYFKTFYEDTDNHYIVGTFYRPFDYSLEWDGNLATVNLEDESFEVLILKKMMILE